MNAIIAGLNLSTNARASILSRDLILCFGEPRDEARDAFDRELAGFHGMHHAYRCYEFWKFERFTLAWKRRVRSTIYEFDLVDCETAQFFAFCEMYNIEFGAIRGTSNNVGRPGQTEA